MNKIDNFRIKQVKQSLTTIINIIAIIGIVGSMVYSCTATTTTTESNNTTEIEGTLTYNNITIKEGSIINVSPNWANRIAGQTVTYSISGRPSGATAENVSIDSASGVISVSNRVVTNDSGEYTIAVTGTGNYGGTITATIQITVNGRDWLRLTDNGGFLVRSTHTSVVLGGEIYVIGGESSGQTNDVWKSSDGDAWTEVTTTATRFPARRRHTSVVLGSEIYVIGGESSGQTNDVWKSSDGGAWTEATTSTSTRFPARDRHTSVVLGDEIYVMGGTGVGNSYLDDVWKSSDGGTNWTEVTTSASTRFSARDRHTSVVLNGDIYVIGGTSGTDVWKSSDGGTNWTEVTTSASTRFSDRLNHTSVVLGGEMYVMGGENSGASFNDVWKSSDGRDWTQVTTSTQFTDRTAHTSVVLGGEIYVIGGFSYRLGSRFNDVWVFR